MILDQILLILVPDEAFSSVEQLNKKVDQDRYSTNIAILVEEIMRCMAKSSELRSALLVIGELLVARPKPYQETIASWRLVTDPSVHR